MTVKVLKARRHLGEGDFKRLVSAMSRMRPKHRFLLTAWAWVFLPDHGHAILLPALPTDRFPSFCSADLICRSAAFLWSERKNRGPQEQVRATGFDRGLRTVKEYLETVEYIPRNPVRRGLVKRAEEWKWSNVRDYAQAALALLVTCH